MNDPRELHITVVVKSGCLTLRDGLPLPAFFEGAQGELRIGASDLRDPNRVPEFLAENTKLFLPARTTLAAEVKRDGVPKVLEKHLVNLVGKGRFLTGVPFTITEEVRITFITGKKGRLENCRCQIPSLNLEAESINEAYTRISEAFEPHRRSHAGNVFSKVFSMKPAVRPLNAIRNEIQSSGPKDGDIL